MTPWRVVGLIVGIVLALIAVAMLVGGGAAVWAHSERDADGFFSSDPTPVAADGYAITSETIDLTVEPGAWFPRNVATIRVRAEGDGLFIGVGPTPDVRRYLRNVPHSVVTELTRDDVTLAPSDRDGDGAAAAPPDPPRGQDFWAATGQDGELRWAVRSGAWSLVVMNADASSGVRTELSVGVKTGLLLPVGIGLLVVGALIAIGATAMIVASTRRRRPRTLPPGATPGRPDAPSRPDAPARP